MTPVNGLPNLGPERSERGPDSTAAGQRPKGVAKNTPKSFQPLETADRLPEGWKWVILGEVCNTSSGGTPSRGNKAFYGGSIPWIKSGELKDGTIERTEESISKLALAQSSAKLLPAGSLLVAMYGANVGKLGVTALEAATNQAVCAVIPGKDVDRDFLFWHLLSERENIIETSFGGAQPNISQTVVRALEIPLPPLAEQKRIAGILKEQMAAVEKARAAAEAQLKAARALPAAYLREVFEGDEAKAWPRVLLSQLSDVTGGIQKTPDRSPVEFYRPFLTVRNVQRGFLDLTQVESFEVTPKELEKLRLKQGDILIVEGNGSPDQIGRNAIFDQKGEWIHQNHIIRVRLDEQKAFFPFVSAFLNSNQGIMQMKEKAVTSSGLYTLSVSKVNGMEIPTPDVSLQKQIMIELNVKLSSAKSMASCCEQQLNDINALPSALMRKAFNGEL